jgi:uncharacterized Zn finger protein
MAWYEWRPYVPVAVRRQNAARDIARFPKKGQPIAPIVIQGRTIARSFWGKAWCDNLELYSDFANRLPRGRTYVRNGSVMDLQLGAGTVKALVCGSELYRISIAIAPLSRPRWRGVVKECAGKIGSLVELLQGKLSRAVMETLIRREAGLFPSAKEITFECSCPDWAAMCKHVAATLYGVGARLDDEPELFFRLRRVDQLDLLTAASGGGTLAAPGGGARKRIAETRLTEVFGIELDESSPEPRTPAGATPGGRQMAAMAAARIPRRRATVRDTEATRAVRPRRAPPGAKADRPVRSSADLPKPGPLRHLARDQEVDPEELHRLLDHPPPAKQPRTPRARSAGRRRRYRRP